MKTLLILAALLCPLILAQTIITSTSTPGTYNWSSTATWVGGVVPNSGTRAVCSSSGVVIVVDVNTTVGDSPASGTPVVTQSGGCLIGINQSVTWTILGGYNKGGTFRRAAGSQIAFDSTGAGSPTSTPYTLSDNGVWTDDATHPPTNTIGNQFTMTSNASGTDFRWVNSTGGSGITGFTNSVVSNCGDPAGSVACLTYTNGGSGVVQIGMTGAPPTAPAVCTTCAPVTFDTTSGIKFGSFTSNDGYNMNVTFKNTYASPAVVLNIQTANVPSGGVTRACTNCVFDLPAELTAPGSVWNYPVFLNGFTNPLSLPALPGQMNYAWMRHNQFTDTTTGQQVLGYFNQMGSFIVEDNLTTISGGSAHSPTPFKTGTLTAASVGTVGGAPSSILTDSAASFPSTMIDSGTSGQGYCVAITSGAAAGTVGNIQLITGSTIMNTARPLWIAAAAGETYAVYNGQQNPHYTSINVTGIATTLSFQHMLGGFIGCDGQGDFGHSMNAVNVTYHLNFTILGSNLARGNLGTLATLGNPASGTIAYDLSSNTFLTAEQAPSICEGCTGLAGKVIAYENNLGWQPPTVNFKYLQTGGPFGLNFSQGSPSAEIADEVAHNCFGGSASCADFNGWYGLYPFSASPGGPGYCSTIVVGCGPVYNVNSTVIMGTHDLVSNIDPGFPNPWANVVTWGYSLGAPDSSDPFQDWAFIQTQIMSVNDPSGHNAAYTPVAFYNYMQSAFTPTVSAYATGGVGGTFIGAVQPMLPPVPNVVLNGTMRTSGNVVW